MADGLRLGPREWGWSARACGPEGVQSSHTGSHWAARVSVAVRACGSASAWAKAFDRAGVAYGALEACVGSVVAVPPTASSTSSCRGWSCLPCSGLVARHHQKDVCKSVTLCRNLRGRALEQRYIRDPRAWLACARPLAPEVLCVTWPPLCRVFLRRRCFALLFAQSGLGGAVTCRTGIGCSTGMRMEN